jgi:6-phosphogluconolactonase (cycloisomerase 2 family)
MDVAADGALTWRSTVSTVEEPAPITMSQDGTLLFVVGQSGAALEVFSVDSGGDLTSAGPAALFDAAAYPQGVAATGI